MAFGYRRSSAPRLVAVAAQKFAWDILEGALYYERQREQRAPAGDAAAGEDGGDEEDREEGPTAGGARRGTSTTLTREALVLSTGRDVRVAMARMGLSLRRYML